MQAKLAYCAGEQAKIVARNIRYLQENNLTKMKSWNSPMTMMIVPIGPLHGVT